MINEVNGLLGDRVTPAVEAEDLVGQGNSSVAFQVGGVRSSSYRSLADEVGSQSRLQSSLDCLLLLAGVLRASKPLHQLWLI